MNEPYLAVNKTVQVILKVVIRFTDHDYILAIFLCRKNKTSTLYHLPLPAAQRAIKLK